MRDDSAGRLRCCRCAGQLDPARPQGLCGCGGMLVYEPDLGAARALDPERLRRLGAGPRALGALLPAQEVFLTLGEGNTPLRPAPALGRACGLPDLWIKDETANPTGSFKDRGLAMAVGVARARGVRRLALASAGNAGVSASLYARAAGLDLKIVMPRVTPGSYVERARACGARIELAGADLGEAGALLRDRLDGEERFDLSTLREPYRVEGKKLIGYEIALSLRERPPHWLVFPTGGGTAVIGVHKALTEMDSLGWLSRSPRLACVQAAGCAPVVRAFEAGEERTRAWEDPQTAAWGLRVPAPLGGERILEALGSHSGAAVAVGEETMRRGARDLWRLERVPAGLEAGAAVAGLCSLIERSVVDPSERVVLLITGSPPGGVDSPQGVK